MRLESARDLKAEVLADLNREGSRVSSGEVAVGIGCSGMVGDFKLAIRAQSPIAVGSNVIRKIRERAKADADVRIVDQAICPAESAAVGVAAPVLRLGASVAHFRSFAGSLGFFARSVADGAVGFVSCNHVIAFEDQGQEGDEVLHPAPFDGGRRPENVVGKLVRYSPLQQPHVSVDCAFASLSESVEFVPSYISASERLQVTVEATMDSIIVEKIGRTTGRTKGRVTAFDLDGIRLGYSFGSTCFTGLIEVESVDERPFSRPGDSGSLVFTANCRPLGLLCSASRAGGYANSGLTYINPIGPVLSCLGVELLV